MQSGVARWTIDALGSLSTKTLPRMMWSKLAVFASTPWPLLDLEAVVEDQPVLVHAAHPQAGLGRADVAVVDHVARAVGAVGGVLRRRGPHAEAVAAVAQGRLDHALLDQVLVRPAGVPLGVALVEDALADHVAAGRPLEERGVPQLERLDVLHQAVPAAVPAGVGRAAAPLEPGVVEHAVADLAPLGLRAVDRESGRTS